MKPLFIYYRYPLYIGGSYFQEFLNSFSKKCEKVFLLASRFPKGRFEKEKNIVFIWVPFLNVSYLSEIFFTFICLLKVIFSKIYKEVEIVNTIGPRGLLAGWYLKKRYGIPLVCTIEILNEEGNSFFGNLYYRFIRFFVIKAPVDKFICWSRYYWENHLKKWGIEEERVVIIPAGISLQKNNPNIDGSEIKRKYSPLNPLVVFAKPLYDYNTLSAKIIIRSLALLKNKIKINVIIGGGDGRQEVEEISKKLKVDDRVFFMPPTAFTEIPKYIAAADLIVLPYTYMPTISRSLLEAMAMGKPIISSSVGEIKNILKDNENAVLTKSEAKTVAEKIKFLLGDKVLSAKISKNAFLTIRRKFSMEITVGKTSAEFQKLLKKKVSIY